MKQLFFWLDQLFASRKSISRRYEAFRSLMDADRSAHEHLAALEEIFYGQRHVDLVHIQRQYDALARAVAQMVTDIDRICPHCYPDLKRYFKRFDGYVRTMQPTQVPPGPPFTIDLRDLTPAKTVSAGAKAVNLGTLAGMGLPVPRGFVITTHAFQTFIAENRLRPAIDDILARLDIEDQAALTAAHEDLATLFSKAQLPPTVVAAMEAALQILIKKSAMPALRLAVRSSALGEDGAASFAGQFSSLLDVQPAALSQAYIQVIMSKYLPRALVYRIRAGQADTETPMAVIVMEMITPIASGVLYTVSENDPDQMDLHAVDGLGERLVDGRVTPERAALTRELQPKIRSQASAAEGQILLDRESARQLGRWGHVIEDHFGAPQDIEWCLDEKDRLHLLQTRPIPRRFSGDGEKLECRFDNDQINGRLLFQGGVCAATGIAAGEVHHISGNGHWGAIPRGAVLVTDQASPQLGRILNRVAAVVTRRGSLTSHFASIAREAGLPLLVDVGHHLDRLIPGEVVTVHADEAKIYTGRVQTLLESPCARPRISLEQPYLRRLEFMLTFVSPLRLTDSTASHFKPAGCRSLHDIIRFTHEMAIQAMFSVSDRRLRKIGGARPMDPGIPMRFFLIDAGGGLQPEAERKKILYAEDVSSRPMQAILDGLTHGDIPWGDFSHFDWGEYDRIVMSGGVVSADAAIFASHVILAAEHVNLNLRFGYHFAILDAHLSPKTESNYAQMRFTGGGADLDQRIQRIRLLEKVLQRLGYHVQRRSDFLEARITAMDGPELAHALEWTGRLLGVTRLMDMYLKADTHIDAWVEDFFNGRCDFASVEM